MVERLLLEIASGIEISLLDIILYDQPPEEKAKTRLAIEFTFGQLGIKPQERLSVVVPEHGVPGVLVSMAQNASKRLTNSMIGLIGGRSLSSPEGLDQLEYYFQADQLIRELLAMRPEEAQAAIDALTSREDPTVN